MNSWNRFFEEVFSKGSYTFIVDGLKNTLLIAVFGLIIGIILGSFLAIFKILPQKSIVKVISRLVDVYVVIFRGIPMVVQLLIIHFIVLKPLNIPNKELIEAIIAFGLNSSAYVCEIMRGGILSVDIGQTEAGRALGLNYGQTMMRIVLPQAIKNVVPTLGNEFIALLKETSVVGFVAGVDLKVAFDRIGMSTLDVIVPYIVRALVYLVLVLAATGIVKLIERRLRAGDRR